MKYRKSWLLLALLAASLATGTLMRGQETPVVVSLCDLKGHPKNLDGKLIRVRGTLSVHFEDFTLTGESCSTEQQIWLMFGGDVPGIVASTANDNFRRAGQKIKLNGTTLDIKKDDNFRRLYALITARSGDLPKFSVTATLQGLFFAGEPFQLPGGQSFYRGYGHLGCCSLLVISEVSDVESNPHADLRLHGAVIAPDGRPADGVTVFDDVEGGSPPQRQQAVTNSRGEFSFTNSGQQLRIRDPRYRPVSLTVEPGGAPVSIPLEESTISDWIVAACSENHSSHRIGFSVGFVLPHSLSSSRVDLGAMEADQAIFVHRKGTRMALAEFFVSTSKRKSQDGPSSLDSDMFTQRWIKDSSGNVIGIDSRGRDKNGAAWRMASFLGTDWVEYSMRTPRATAEYDKVIDSACIKKR